MFDLGMNVGSGEEQGAEDTMGKFTYLTHLGQPIG